MILLKHDYSNSTIGIQVDFSCQLFNNIRIMFEEVI